MKQTSLAFHLLAIVIVVVWGTTFVSTKILLDAGLSAAAIFVIRFTVAYLTTVILSHDRLWCESLTDELLAMALGVTGGSLYFLTENLSLAFTATTNTSLIVCSCPLFATMMICAFFHQRLSRMQVLGAILAFMGMAAVVLNGQFVLHLSPIGDALAFAACLSWAVYSALIRLLLPFYSAAFINRKTFFYGILSIIPWFIFFPNQLPDFALFSQPLVLCNLAFLSLIASAACFCLWTVCIRHLGVIQATNYVYLNPISTMVAAALILSEPITPWFLTGSALILCGLFLHNIRSTKQKEVQS